MTRENSVWRLPLHADGTTTKVAKFCECRAVYERRARLRALSLELTRTVSGFGIVGPDGLTVDQSGNLFISHPSLVCIFVVTPHGVPLARIVPPEGHGTSITNCIFGSTDADRKRLYFTDSTVGRICYVDWDVEGGTPVRSTNGNKQ